ncbi:DUF4760 domain-containing protein [Shewanella sp. VB17]|uniref:DUF4760 domain-containing protein n=1 Tax=Shewanella sp. VB17 TaxID=2739432 RepID=UPI00156709B7|nr:DUF4760 domain-containing protein [Shewanella sp. VB17]NRD73272.1 DUF4760 domain-containing protein [Shewanella sp. VB17]
MHRRKNYTFYIIVYFLFLLLLGLSCISYAHSDYYSAGAIILSAVIALSAAAVNIFYIRRTARESNSLHFQQSLLNSIEYANNVDIMVKAIKKRHDFPLEDYAKDEHALTSEAKAIRYTLNSWEEAANAMKHDIYDEIYLYNSHKSTVLYIGLMLRSYINAKQKVNVSFFESFNWLVLKWAIRRDSFEEKETKKQLKKVFKDLSNIKSGKITSAQL